MTSTFNIQTATKLPITLKSEYEGQVFSTTEQTIWDTYPMGMLAFVAATTSTKTEPTITLKLKQDNFTIRKRT